MDSKVPQKVYDHLTRMQRALCDDCIKDATKLPNRQQVQQVTATLGVTPLFNRSTDKCTACEKRKLVIVSA